MRISTWQSAESFTSGSPQGGRGHARLRERGMGLARVAGLEQPRGKILLAPSCQYRRSGRILPLPWFRACRSRAFPPGTVQSELHSPHSGHPIPDPGGPFRSAALNDGRHLPPLHKPAASTRRGLTLSLSLSLSLSPFFLSFSLSPFFLSLSSFSLSLSLLFLFLFLFLSIFFPLSLPARRSEDIHLNS